MSSLAAALKPDSSILGDAAGVELDAVVSVDGQVALALLRLDVPAGDALAELGLVGFVLGQHVPSALEHVDVSDALVAGGGDDEVGLDRLLTTEAAEGTLGGVVNLDLQAVALGGDAGDLAAAEDAVGPGLLVGADVALLLVHQLVELLDEVEANDAVVGGAGLGEEVVARLGRSGPEAIDILRVEDGVDAVGWKRLGVSVSLQISMAESKQLS